MKDDLTAKRLAYAKSMWRYAGNARPPFALPPAPGQESVWDYPRPPHLVPDLREVVIMANGIELARSHNALRLLETASPPTFYLPRKDIAMHLLIPGSGTSHCEWKGEAVYGSVRLPAQAQSQQFDNVAWSYAKPLAPYEALADYVGFYPQPLECFVNGERVRAQPGRFYAGWVTAEVVGPFKGEPGSGGW